MKMKRLHELMRDQSTVAYLFAQYALPNAGALTIITGMVIVGEGYHMAGILIALFGGIGMLVAWWVMDAYSRALDEEMESH